MHFGMLMTERIRDGDVPFRKAYIRSVVEKVVVNAEAITIHGCPAALRTAMAASLRDGGGVPSSVQEWRTRQDSNL